MAETRSPNNFFKQIDWQRWLFPRIGSFINLASSHGLVVKVEDSQPRGRGIEPQLVPYTEWNVS